MRFMTMVAAIPVKSFALLLVLGTAYLSISQQATAQDAATPYPTMAPVEQYLMDRNQEIALARSAAPEAISHDATVLVLSRHGYEAAVEGKNGWVCWVGRGWGGMFDWPEFWSPKIRAADCMNPPAARSILPFVYKRTELLLTGHSKVEVIAAMKVALDKDRAKDGDRSKDKKEFSALEPGTVDYMMSKSSYLTDQGGHNMPHIMFYAPIKDAAAWGANLPNSPVMGVSYWYLSEQSYPQLQGFPPITVFLIAADKWSDGTPGPSM